MSSTPRERFLAAARGESPDAPPAWMMRQAGRYLPEYRELRSGQTFMETLAKPDVVAEITLQPIRRFGMDAAVIFSDILVPCAAMGLDVSFVEKRGPVLEPQVRSRADVEALKIPEPERDYAHLAQALRLVREDLGDERALIGFCGAPWTIASYMVEGGSSKNYENTKRLLYAEPETFDALMTALVDALIPLLEIQVQAGADLLQVFDSWGGAFDAATYRRAILPHLERLVAGAKATGVPVTLYANGGGHLMDELLDAKPDVISLDWRVDVAQVRSKVGSRVALQGNLDPCILFADEDIVRRETNRVLDAFSGHCGHIFNLGSGILPPTPIPSVKAMFETVYERR